MRRRVGHRTLQARLDGADARPRGLVRGSDIHSLLHRARHDDGRGPAQVVEQHDRPGEHHHHVRDAQIVLRHVGQVLHRPHQVVAEEPHRAAPEREGILRWRHRDTVHQRLDRTERIARVQVLHAAVVAVQRDPAALGADHALRLDADHRVAAQALPLLGALQQEARTPVAQLQHGADGRLAVVQVGMRHRHLPVLARPRAHALERRRYRHVVPGRRPGHVDAEGGHPSPRLRDASSSATSARRISMDCHRTTRWYRRSALS